MQTTSRSAPVGNLANHEATRQLIADAGAISQLLDMIKAKDTSENGKVYACGAVHNLGHADKLKEQIFSAGAVPVMLNIIQNGSCGGKSIFTQLLVVLCMNISLRQGIAEEGMSIILDTCRTGNAACQEYSVFLFGLLMTNPAVAAKCAVDTAAAGGGSGTATDGIISIVTILSDLLCNATTVGLRSKAAMALTCVAKHPEYKDYIGTCTALVAKIIQFATPATVTTGTTATAATSTPTPSTRTTNASAAMQQQALSADEALMQKKELEVNAAHALLALSQTATFVPASANASCAAETTSIVDYSDDSKYALLNKLNDLGSIPAYVNILSCTSGIYTENDKDKACAAIGALCYPSEVNAVQGRFALRIVCLLRVSALHCGRGMFVCTFAGHYTCPNPHPYLKNQNKT